MNATYEVKELPAWHVATMRHVGAYDQIGTAFERLYAWAGQRGLLRFPETQTFAIYHDDPGSTPSSALRSDACITVPAETPVDGDVGTLDIPCGLYAVGHFEIAPVEFGAAWAKVGEFIRGGAYVPDDRPCYEWYLNDPDQHPEHKFVVNICEPVRPAV